MRNTLVAATAFATTPSWANTTSPQLSQRGYGLLLGGLIGDALGGPIEFMDPGLRPSPSAGGPVHARKWPDGRRLTDDTLSQLATDLPMLGYEELRPDPAPYGPWPTEAPLGTITDDSRHKIVLLRALAHARNQGRAITKKDIANALIQFQSLSPTNRDLEDEGLREYRYAARWLLGERDLTIARPIERLWAGVNNCSGQMMFPPLALAYAGDPALAYRRTYELDFIDAPIARDITAALVAGLSQVCGRTYDNSALQERWDALLNAMQQVDPYDYQSVPFAGRQLNRWMSLANRLADQAEGEPKRLYELLETDGQPHFWWDAHFTLIVPLAILKLCDYQPLAALHLALDFGHDTDSYAQVLGCMIGAVHGAEVFPDTLRVAVENRLEADYGESLQTWFTTLGR